MSSTGKSVRLFLVEGTPGGLVTAEIMNWTGHVLAGPRSDLAAVLRREEAHRTGVYILLGDSPDSVGGTQIYIGEGDEISTRLSSHAREKDFWQRAVVLTSKDANLTKAHARYLESRLIQIASEASRADLTNGTAPPLIALPEADVSDMEYFITQALIALPVLGVNVFRSRATQPHAAGQISDESSTLTRPQFVIRARDGRVATAEEVDGDFIVLAGSQVRREHTGAGSYVDLRVGLERDGTIDTAVEPAAFTRDQVFASPSAAASVVSGHSANGRALWLEVSSGLRYGDWQNQLLEQATTSISSRR